MRTRFGPLHLLFFTEAFAHDLMHRGLYKTHRDRLTLVISLLVIRYQVPVATIYVRNSDSAWRKGVNLAYVSLKGAMDDSRSSTFPSALSTCPCHSDHFRRAIEFISIGGRS